MGLSASLTIAQTALATAAAQSNVLSRNIANVSNTAYARKTANVITAQNGSSTVASIGRATDAALFSSSLQAQSDSASQTALTNGLSQIQNSLGLNNTTTSATSATSATDQSPSTMIANLSNALQAYASAPDTAASGTAVITAANNLVSSLNQASATVQQVREQADNQIAASVTTINSLLSQFQTINQQIIAGQAVGADVTDSEDTRDSILSQLSNQVGITTSTNANGGMSIYTDSGVTLFDQTARQLSFTPTPAFSAGTTGGNVTVDGIAITGASNIMSVQSGALAGLTQLRDTVAPAYQDQLDQIAGSVISSFAETDSSNPSNVLAGLFTNGSSTTLPTSTTGLAASITVNANADPSKGGDVTRLRDGDISGVPSQNTSSDAAYSGQLNNLITSLNATRSFNSASGGIASGSIASYASSSVSWLESSYQTASNEATYRSSVLSTATSALSNSTGVNLDDQMSQMLDIEHAYQASAQLLNTVNSMYTSLIQALN